jgi:hypothetical protein
MRCDSAGGVSGCGFGGGLLFASVWSPRCRRCRADDRFSLLCLSLPRFFPGVLGKRFGRDDDFAAGGSKRKKLSVPIDAHPDVNWPQAVFDFKHSVERETGVRVSLRGRGSMSGEVEDEEPMYVLLQAESDIGMDAATVKVQDFLANPNARDQQLIVQNNFVSPLGKKEGNPETFSLSNALYANDHGFTMVAPVRTPEQMREERQKAMLRPGEQAKDVWVQEDKGQPGKET